jgi:hypothetical protein
VPGVLLAAKLWPRGKEGGAGMPAGASSFIRSCLPSYRLDRVGSCGRSSLDRDFGVGANGKESTRDGGYHKNVLSWWDGVNVKNHFIVGSQHKLLDLIGAREHQILSHTSWSGPLIVILIKTDRFIENRFVKF